MKQNVAPKELSAKQKKAVEMLASPEFKGSTVEACKKLGISRVTLWRWQKNPAFARYMRELIDRVAQGELATVWKALIGKCEKGDIKAIRLYFEMMDKYREMAAQAEAPVASVNPMSILSKAFYSSYASVMAGDITELVEKGGRGSAKSSGISVILVDLLRLHPECHAVVFRKVQNTLRTTVYAQVCWAINELGLTDLFRCTVSPMECTYIPTGQKIMFFGLDDPGKVKSIKVPFGYIGMAWFEELDQYDGPEEIRNVEQSVFRGGAYSMCFKSFNPPAMARNWANQYVLEPKEGKLVHHSTYLTTPEDWLGPRFLADAQHLKETNETGYRHEYLGEVVGSGTAVFENLEFREITDEEIANFDRVTSGVDWGWYPDPWAWNRMHYDSSRKILYIFDELTRRRTSNQDTAQLIRERISDDELVMADSAEEKSCSDYRAFGLHCRGAEKGPGSVRESMKWLASRVAIVIDPVRCPDTAKEFGEYEYERDKKTNEVLEGYPDAANHHIDAVRYGTNKIWKRRGQ